MTHAGIKFRLLLRCALLSLALPSCESRDDDAKRDGQAAPKNESYLSPALRDGPGAFGFEDLPGDGTTLANLPRLIEDLNIKALYSAKPRLERRLRIAILDNGFTGLNASLGKTLPRDAVLIKGETGALADTNHGVKIGEVVYALATGSQTPLDPWDDRGPEMYFINTNGFSNLRSAIDTVIEKEIDMVVYAQVWEYGGNLDGGGFINAEVNRATNAGVLWLNAAGNFGKSSFASPIEVDLQDLHIRLPFAERYVRFAVKQAKTSVKIVLGWNDFDESTAYRTSQDLDLILQNEAGVIVGRSELLQQGGDAESAGGLYSAHARELIRTTLEPGIYYVRIPAKSVNFTKEARLHLAIDGYKVEVLDRGSEDVLLIPADNDSVLTVGAADVDYSSRRLTRGKPELEAPSTLIFQNGMVIDGTSAAVAVVAGSLAAYLRSTGLMTRGALVERLPTVTIPGPPPVLRFSYPALPLLQ